MDGIERLLLAVSCLSFPVISGCLNDRYPTGVKLTSYSGEASDISAEQLQSYVSLVESGKLKLKVGPRFEFDRLQEAHKLMDNNLANGKIVIELV